MLGIVAKLTRSTRRKQGPYVGRRKKDTLRVLVGAVGVPVCVQGLDMKHSSGGRDATTYVEALDASATIRLLPVCHSIGNGRVEFNGFAGSKESRERPGRAL